MRRGRFIAYDKQRVLEEIVRGKLSAQEIADKFGITRDMVYSLKHSAKKKHIILDPTPRVADLEPISRKVYEPNLAGDIHRLALRWREGEISDLDFYKRIQGLLD